MRESYECLRWFDKHLKGIDTDPAKPVTQEPPVTVFVRDYTPPSVFRVRDAGAFCNKAQWPPRDTRTTYAWGERASPTAPWIGTAQTGKQTATLESVPRLLSNTAYHYDLQGRLSQAMIETHDAASGSVTERSSSDFRYDTHGSRVSATQKLERDLDGTPTTLELVSDVRTTFLNDSAAL